MRDILMKIKAWEFHLFINIGVQYLEDFKYSRLTSSKFRIYINFAFTNASKTLKCISEMQYHILIELYNKCH